MIIKILPLIIIFSIIAPNFLTFNNFLNILTQVSILGLLSLGTMFLLIVKCIDLSIAAVIPFSITVASLFNNIYLIVIICLLVGIFNGFIVSKFKINPFITTFSVTLLLRGLTNLISNGHQVRIDIYNFTWIDPILIFGMLCILSWYILNFTIFGLCLYATGDNYESAEMQCVNVKRIQFIAYVICSIIVGFASILFLLRTQGSINPNAAMGFETTAIAMALIGGIKFSGGFGGIKELLTGVFSIGIIFNGLSLLGFNSSHQNIATSLIIIVIMILNKKDDVSLEGEK